MIRKERFFSSSNVDIMSRIRIMPYQFWSLLSVVTLICVVAFQPHLGNVNTNHRSAAEGSAALFGCKTARMNNVTVMDAMRSSQMSDYPPEQLSSLPSPLSLTDCEQHEALTTTTTTSTVADPDGVRRRQMLLSMLGASSSTPFVMMAATARADENAVTESPIPVAAVDENSTSTTPVTIIKPPMDKRDYSTYVLSNGLRVLLCSDPTVNEAAAAMDVHVGAMADPADVPGLAHFNEHMLFLGTKKYPQESSYESFLASNGGKSNAYTDSENTVYYFDMEAESDSKFAEGLNRFGSFFSAPLFTQTATGRELNAIESENAKNLQSDAFRIFQISKSRVNPDHPLSKFFTGNKKTLLEDTKAKGLDLRQQLIAFYNRHYSANQMTLAVVAPQSMENLKNMVDKAFQDIPNRGVDKPEAAWAGVPPYLSATDTKSIIPSFGHVVKVVPVSELRQVTLAWPIIYRSEQDKLNARLVKPSEYVGHLIGHEGIGSLVSCLKRRGWVNSLSASSGDELSDFESFEITIDLTTSGLEAVDDVIEAVFSYISLMRDKAIPDYVLEEVLQIDEIRWRFLAKGGIGAYAQSLATAMQLYPPNLYVAGPRRLALDDASLINTARTTYSSKEQLGATRKRVEEVVSLLTVDNCLITMMSKTFKGKTNKVEKWYGTEYSAFPIPSATLQKWRNPPSHNKLKIDFPKPNPFIPSEAGLRVKKNPSAAMVAAKRTFESRMQPLPPPVVIRDDGLNGQWKVYFKQDDRFGQPNAFIIFQVMTKEVYATPLQAVLSSFYELCVSECLTEYAYDAELTGLSYDVRAMPRGLRLTFGGYNDKLGQFASYVARKLKNGAGDILPKNEAEFERYKDQITRGLTTFDVKQPYAHASYYSQLVQNPTVFQYSNQELRDATEKSTLADLVGYAKGLWSSGKGEALVQGNLYEDEALKIVNSISSALPFKPIPESDYPPRLKALPLPTSGGEVPAPRLLVAEPNPSNENAVSHVTLQSLGKSEKDHVLIELINAIVTEPFYNELRTKQQLGYIVSSGVRGIGTSRTIGFIVQSSIAPAEKLTVEIFKFLDTVEDKLLKTLSKGDFAVYVKSLIDRKTEPDKQLIDEVTRNWGEIASGRLQFDRIQQEAAALLELEKDDLIRFWKKIYSANGRRALMTEVIPRKGVASSQTPPASTGYERSSLQNGGLLIGVNDIGTFRKDRESWTEEDGVL